jgi:hypothetical protein
MKEKEIKALVKHILMYHREASIFNYYGVTDEIEPTRNYY